jgi:hypothetical protein
MGTFSEAVEIAWLRRPQLVSASHEHCYVGQTGEQRPWRVNDDRPSDEIDVAPFDTLVQKLGWRGPWDEPTATAARPRGSTPSPSGIGRVKRLSRLTTYCGQTLPALERTMVDRQ